MNYSSVKNPTYSDPENKALTALVKFDHLESEVTFIARGDDVEEHGRELYQRACNGDFGTVAQYTAPNETVEQKQAKLKTGITIALDVKAKSLAFESFADAMTYVDEPSVPLYQQQAQALRSWRSLCWARYDEVVATAKDFDVVATVEALPAFTL